jgi:hypothetical protein
MKSILKANRAIIFASPACASALGVALFWAREPEKNEVIQDATPLEGPDLTDGPVSAAPYFAAIIL